VCITKTLQGIRIVLVCSGLGLLKFFLGGINNVWFGTGTVVLVGYYD